MSTQKNKSNSSKPLSKGKKNRWWQKALPAWLFWPLSAVFLLSFILSLVNIWSWWCLRKEIKSDLALLTYSYSQLEPLVKENNSNDGNYLPSNSDVRKQVDNILKNNSKNNNTSVNESPDTGNNTNTATANNNVSNNNISTNKQNTLNEEAINGMVASFGDGFSSLAYIDKANTNLYWDENVAAFSFPPLYSIKDEGACSSLGCSLSDADADPKELCLNNVCLRKEGDNKLYFKGKELSFPPPLRQKEIENITIFTDNKDWLIGLVSGPKDSEEGWVYRFDGLSFIPLITDTTDYKIQAKYKRGGGRIAFGGSPDDFIIFYSGYDGRAYRVRQGKIEDISSFFGLRVTNGGFKAQILKIGEGENSNFYICSLKQGMPKLLKIWSADNNTSGGILDLSPLIFGKDIVADKIICGISSVKDKTISISTVFSSLSHLYSFKDEGFDISRDRVAQSIDLNKHKQSDVQAAVLAALGLNIKDGIKSEQAEFYLANKIGDFQKTEPYLWTDFSASGNSLYWRLALHHGDNPYYSPWFSNVNRLDYLY